MATKKDNDLHETNSIDHRFRSLFENDPIQNFLQRHELGLYGGIPIRKDEIEKRLQQIDEQSSADLIAQSLIEKALDIKRPFKRSGQRAAFCTSKQSIKHNSHVPLYDNPCGVTLLYCGSTTSRNDTLHTLKIQGDEVMVMQYQSNATSTLVYKSFLKPNDEFTFKSHRFLDRPFTIAIYINGVIDSRISTCCEQGYLKQRHLQLKRSLCQLLFVFGGTPCYTCLANDLTDLSTSDNEEIQSEWISMIGFDQKSTFDFQTIPCKSELFEETDSTTNATTKSDLEISKQSTTTKIGNNETGKHLKNKNNLFKTENAS